MKIYSKANLFLKNKLKSYFIKVLRRTGNDIKNVSVGVKFVDDEEIRSLNSEHRGVDKVTDVLSFPMFEIMAGEKIESVLSDVDKVEGEIYLGDIVICKNKIYSQAKEFGHSRKREFFYLAVHSFLHLLGYDHQTDDEEKQMYDLAESILGYGR